MTLREDLWFSLKGLICPLGSGPRPILLIILLSALVLRLVFYSQIPLPSGLIDFKPAGTDMKTYYDWAFRIADGDWIGKGVFYYNPLYPYFLGLLFTLFGRNLGIVAFFQITLGLVSLVFIYAIGKEVFGEAIGLLAAAMGAFYNMFILYEQVLLPESLGVLLSLGAFYLLLRFQEDQRAYRVFLAGAFLGLSALNRSIFLALAPFIGAWVLINKRVPKGKKPLSLVYFLLPMALVIAPVTLRNYLVGGDLVLLTSNGGVNFFIGNSRNSEGVFHYPPPYEDINRRINLERLRPSEASRLWFREAVKSIKQEPGRYLNLLLRKIALFWGRWDVPNNIDYETVKRYSSLLRNPLLSFGLLAPLGLTGAFLSLAWIRKAFLLHLFVVVYSLSVVAFFVVGRFRLPMAPFLMVFGAYTLCYWYERFKEGKYPYVFWSLILFMTLWMAVNLQPLYTQLGV